MKERETDTYDIDSLNDGVAVADEHVIRPEVMNHMPEHETKIEKNGKAIDPKEIENER